MKTFCVTFGVQYHREDHPAFGRPIPTNGYLLVVAESELAARRAVIDKMDLAWSMSYTPEEFYNHDPEYIGPVIGVLTETGLLIDLIKEGSTP